MANQEQQSAQIDARIEQLELKLMDLEMSFSELNDVVLRQYRDIERLAQTNAALEKRLDSLNDNNAGPSPSAADEVPPHY